MPEPIAVLKAIMEILKNGIPECIYYFMDENYPPFSTRARFLL